MRFFGGTNFSFKAFKLFYSSYFLIRSKGFSFAGGGGGGGGVVGGPDSPD